MSKECGKDKRWHRMTEVTQRAFCAFKPGFTATVAYVTECIELWREQCACPAVTPKFKAIMGMAFKGTQKFMANMCTWCCKHG